MSRIVNGSEDICDGMVVILLELILSVFNVVMVVSHEGIVFKLMAEMSRLLRNFRLDIPLPESDERIMLGLFAIFKIVKSGK
jgi:hypothetical protein